MKSSTYSALCQLNFGIDVAIEALSAMKNEGIWDDAYVHQKREILEHHRAGINRYAHNRLQASATEDEELVRHMEELPPSQ